jgi:VWFA-related protein
MRLLNRCTRCTAAVGWLMALALPAAFAQVDVSAWPEVRMELSITAAPGSAPADVSSSLVSLTDSGHPQNVASLKPIVGPQSICLLLDNSNSMRGKLPQLKSAAARFLQSLPAEDEVCVATIGPALAMRTKLTQDHAAAAASLQAVEAHGGSGLLDGIMNAAEYMRDAARNRSRTFVLFSDAFDNRSLSDERTFRQQMELSGSPVLYLVDYAGSEASPAESGRTDDMLSHEMIAEAVARGGGTACAPAGERQLAAALDALKEQLHRRYLLAYTVEMAARDGQERRLQVTLNAAYAQQGLRITAPGGSYAPSQ